MAHKGHAANKRNAGNKKRIAANKKESLEIKNIIAANKKTKSLQINKNRCK